MVVYVLELTEGRYYVGRTSNLRERLAAHASGNGSEMTKRYPMVSLIETHNEDSAFYEDMITKMMMAKYGIDKVRGGSYSQVYLPKSKYLAIVNELRGAEGTCFRCGGPHVVRHCPEPRVAADLEDQVNEQPSLAYRIVASAGRKTTRAINWLWS